MPPNVDVGKGLPTYALALMRAVKNQFDPAGILNPGKFFPDA